MTKELKEKILYSDEVTNIIKNYKTECIFLGGSSLEQLESPDSDYNIIIITSEDSNFLFNLTIDIPQNVLITSCNILEILKIIHNPFNLYNYYLYEKLKYLLMLPNDNILYSSLNFQKFLTKLKKYVYSLSPLYLEGSLHSSRKLISDAISSNYTKNIYYFFKAYLYWKNYYEENLLDLKEEQKTFLLQLKESKTIPNNLYVALRDIYPYHLKTKRYDYYTLWKELISIWEKKYL